MKIAHVNREKYDKVFIGSNDIGELHKMYSVIIPMVSRIDGVTYSPIREMEKYIKNWSLIRCANKGYLNHKYQIVIEVPHKSIGIVKGMYMMAKELLG